QGQPVAVVPDRPAASLRRPLWGPLDTVSRMLTDNISASARMALPLARVLPKLAVAGLRSVARSVLSAGGGAPRTRFNSNVVAARVWNSVTLDLAVVKQIKNLVPGATVNDAVLAIIGGAMRRYLEDKGELPERSLVTVAPVNTRQGGEAAASGNTVSMLTFPLGTNVEDPLERLETVYAATSESKAMQNAIGAEDLTNLQKFAPPAAWRP
ncbi:MAG: WS/DGAT domain-containing protein, partial [Gemmatimonadales bacterium]